MKRSVSDSKVCGIISSDLVRRRLLLKELQPPVSIGCRKGNAAMVKSVGSPMLRNIRIRDRHRGHRQMPKARARVKVKANGREERDPTAQLHERKLDPEEMS